MSIKAIISMETEDFDKLSKVFNSSDAQNARSEAGLNAELHKNIDNPNNAVVIGEIPSKESFIGFMLSPVQKERMKNAGVSSPPTFTFIESI